MFARLATGLVALVLVGCAPATTLRSARTVEPGRLELVAGAAVVSLPEYNMVTGGDGGGDFQSYRFTLPQTTFGARLGLTDWADIGARASLGGLEVEGAVGLKAGFFAFAAAPSAGVRWTTGADHAFDVQLPLLFGFGLVPGQPRRVELTLGAVGRFETEWGSAPRSGFFVGGSAGLTVFVSTAVFLRAEYLQFWPLGASPELGPRNGRIGAHDYFHTRIQNGALALGWLY
ncbi:MAG TPA: hypothetical protein VGK67_07590 [Myxococcales bacterium]|jgi:hypothetical protein